MQYRTERSMRWMLLCGVGLSLAVQGCPNRRRNGPGGPGENVTMQWSQNATAYRGRVGTVLNVTCGPGAPGTVWGTDLYSDDSSVCTAALHSGRITAAGGTFQIQIAPGAPQYMPSLRNNVTTRQYGVWSGSFLIVGGAAPGMVAVPVLPNGMPPVPTGMPPMPTIPPVPPLPTGMPPVPNGNEWSQNAVSRRGQVGTSFVHICTPGGTLGTVWGTDIYSDDSSLCTAAVHAGRITQAVGGPITVFIHPGQPSYQGSPRNGVTTQNYGAWSGSFAFTPAGANPMVPTPPTPPAAGQPVEWTADGRQFRGRNGESIVVACPAGAPTGSVWGTGMYTDDSSICTAAVHAGIITAAGGSVTVRPMPGMPSYQGTTANGVTTQDYPAYEGSYMLSR